MHAVREGRNKHASPHSKSTGRFHSSLISSGGVPTLALFPLCNRLSSCLLRPIQLMGTAQMLLFIYSYSRNTDVLALESYDSVELPPRAESKKTKKKNGFSRSAGLLYLVKI